MQIINYFIYSTPVFYFFVNSFLTIFILLLCIAFITLAERKIIAAIQRRKGPNTNGVWGVFQPFADGFKLLLKEIVKPTNSYAYLYFLAPIWSFICSMCHWAVIPFSYTDIIANVNYSLLYTFILSSFSVYGIIVAGWASQSRYPFLGAVRAGAQLISYEVSISLVFVIVTLCASSLNYIEIVAMQHDTIWFIFLMPLVAYIFWVSSVAETNRAPFDLVEAEA